MIDRLESIARRYRDIENEMARPDVATDHEKLTKLAREQRSLREIVEAYGGYRRARHDMDEKAQGGQAPLVGNPPKISRRYGQVVSLRLPGKAGQRGVRT